MRDQTAEQFRPIRALLRGLETLETLNREDGLTVTEVASQTGLPRTTAYRVLETLCAGGFVLRDEADDCYRPTQRVQSLAHGFADEQWITAIAQPEMEALCRRILWPLMLSTVSPSGELRLRVVTDHMSPLALERYHPGDKLGLADSPAGVMRLACAGPEQREALLHVAALNGSLKEDIQAAAKLAEDAADKDYALDLRVVSGEAGIAVPIRNLDGDLVAVLCMRFIRSALTPEDVTERFHEPLRNCADRIARAL